MGVILIWLNVSDLHPYLIVLTSGSMSLNDPATIPDAEEDLDDPYVHTVSTEEFIETVERATQEEND